MNRMHGISSLLIVALGAASCTDEAQRQAPSGAEPAAEAPAHAEAPRPSEAPIAAAPRVAPERFRVPIEGLPSYGPSDARVTIVEATDYDCPYCSRAEATMATLREKHPRDVRVVVLPAPLPMHPRAEPAALASLAVFVARPEAFAAMHGKLFEDPRARTDADLVAFAESAGLSSRSYGAALAGPQPRAILARAAKIAHDLHVVGTPTFFVNGRLVRGAQPVAAFETIVDEEVSHAFELEGAGVPRGALYGAIMKEARAIPSGQTTEEDGPAIVKEARGVGGAHFLGPANARTTMTLFTDLACPFCAKLDGRLRELSSKHPDVAIVLRHAPLPMHEDAPLAARAAIAAEAQGKLAPFVAEVFSNGHSQERRVLEEHARRAGLDMARFTKDLDAPWTQKRLDDDRALAKKLGVTGTPTTFVEDRRIVGAQPLAAFEAAIAQSKEGSN